MSKVSLIIALSLLVGVASQLLARVLRIPGIVVLLVFGVLLGPDGMGIIETANMGAFLPEIVGTAVAIILFEGGLSLRLSQMRRQSKVIINLISSGALITAIGGTLTAHYVLEWSWTLSSLFGSLVIVTGPTVIGPLLRRINVKRNVNSILNAEAVLIDPIGAIISLVALDVVTSSASADLDLAHGALEFLYRFGFGGLVGAISGIAIARSLKFERLIPPEYSNVFVLACVLFVFHACNEVFSESGIMAVTIAGMVVGNLNVPIQKELSEFKEQLTVMLIGMLFILLAADTRIGTIVNLGMRSILLIAVLVLIVRPIAVVWCTHNSSLSWREKLFISLMSPRGIVAAAVASLFASTLAASNLPGGEELRAAVFFVIASTVIVQGVFAGPLASALGIRIVQSGMAFFGGHALNRLMAHIAMEHDEDIVLIDRNIDNCRACEEEGLPVVMGDALSISILKRANITQKRYLIAATPNDNLNHMIIRRCRSLSKRGQAFVSNKSQSFDESLLKSIQASSWIGGNVDVGFWTQRIENDEVEIFLGDMGDMSMSQFSALNKLFLEHRFHMIPIFIVKDGQIDIFKPTISTLPKQATTVMMVYRPAIDELLMEFTKIMPNIRKSDRTRKNIETVIGTSKSHSISQL